MQVRARERTVPKFVEREFREFLDCGIAAHGFLRLHCDDCGLDRVVPFSCKRRGFCPSCGGRHMADTAAHLVDRVLPRVPVRQWVLSLPFGLRYRLAHDRGLTADVLRLFVRAIFVSLRRRCRRSWSTTDAAHGGAVTFVQRFGGALNLNVHFHTLVLDGVYRVREADGALRFHPLPPPSCEELEAVLTRVVRGIGRLIQRRGLADEPDRLFTDDPLLAQLLAAAVRGRVATGPRAGQRVLRFGDRVEIASGEGDATERTPGLVRAHGFSLHAGVAVPPNDRQRLERLCRYAGRPPVATERLSEMADGRLLYALRHGWKDGTTHVAFEPLELIDRLAALVPPPRFHTVRYHGVLASRSKHRAEVVPVASMPEAAEGRVRIPGCGHRAAPAKAHPATASASAPGPLAPQSADREVERASGSRASRPSREYSWSELMRRVFEVDVLRCPRCHASPMRILAAIHPPTAQAILKSMGLPTRAPPVAAAQTAPEDWPLAEPLPASDRDRPRPAA
ncbi:MAG TPA: transposase [Gammaproteobacteria bacterium]